MSVIVKTEILLLFITTFSFYSRNSNDNKISRNKSKDTVGNFVVFSIYNPNTIESKTKRLDFYYHDSLGYGHPVTIAGINTNLSLSAPTGVATFEQTKS